MTIINKKEEAKTIENAENNGIDNEGSNEKRMNMNSLISYSVRTNTELTESNTESHSLNKGLDEKDSSSEDNQESSKRLDNTKDKAVQNDQNTLEKVLALSTVVGVVSIGIFRKKKIK